ncbi:hypothetical protein DIPPA_25327 [Diplonema papillatum]|nr:hypothetical protein DIPPA_25327 [Diplonema papillatum]
MSLYNAQRVIRKRKSGGVLRCRYCGYSAMYEDALHAHMVGYHGVALGKGLDGGRSPPATPAKPSAAGPQADYFTSARHRNGLLHDLRYPAELSTAALGLPHHQTFLAPNNDGRGGQVSTDRLRGFPAYDPAETDPLTPAKNQGFYSAYGRHARSPVTPRESPKRQLPPPEEPSPDDGPDAKPPWYDPFRSVSPARRSRKSDRLRSAERHALGPWADVNRPRAAAGEKGPTNPRWVDSGFGGHSEDDDDGSPSDAAYYHYGPPQPAGLRRYSTRAPGPLGGRARSAGRAGGRGGGVHVAFGRSTPLSLAARRLVGDRTRSRSTHSGGHGDQSGDYDDHAERSGRGARTPREADGAGPMGHRRSKSTHSGGYGDQSGDYDDHALSAQERSGRQPRGAHTPREVDGAGLMGHRARSKSTHSGGYGDQSGDYDVLTFSAQERSGRRQEHRSAGRGEGGTPDHPSRGSRASGRSSSRAGGPRPRSRSQASLRADGDDVDRNRHSVRAAAAVRVARLPDEAVMARGVDWYRSMSQASRVDEGEAFAPSRTSRLDDVNRRSTSQTSRDEERHLPSNLASDPDRYHGSRDGQSRRSSWGAGGGGIASRSSDRPGAQRRRSSAMLAGPKSRPTDHASGSTRQRVVSPASEYQRHPGKVASPNAPGLSLPRRGSLHGRVPSPSRRSLSPFPDDSEWMGPQAPHPSDVKSHPFDSQRPTQRNKPGRKGSAVLLTPSPVRHDDSACRDPTPLRITDPRALNITPPQGHPSRSSNQASHPYASAIPGSTPIQPHILDRNHGSGARQGSPNRWHSANDRLAPNQNNLSTPLDHRSGRGPSSSRRASVKYDQPMASSYSAAGDAIFKHVPTAPGDSPWDGDVFDPSAVQAERVNAAPAAGSGGFHTQSITPVPNRHAARGGLPGSPFSPASAVEASPHTYDGGFGPPPSGQYRAADASALPEGFAEGLRQSQQQQQQQGYPNHGPCGPQVADVKRRLLQLGHAEQPANSRGLSPPRPQFRGAATTTAFPLQPPRFADASRVLGMPFHSAPSAAPGEHQRLVLTGPKWPKPKPKRGETPPPQSKDTARRTEDARGADSMGQSSQGKLQGGTPLTSYRETEKGRANITVENAARGASGTWESSESSMLEEQREKTDAAGEDAGDDALGSVPSVHMAAPPATPVAQTELGDTMNGRERQLRAQASGNLATAAAGKPPTPPVMGLMHNEDLQQPPYSRRSSAASSAKSERSQPANAYTHGHTDAGNRRLADANDIPVVHIDRAERRGSPHRGHASQHSISMKLSTTQGSDQTAEEAEDPAFGVDPPALHPSAVQAAPPSLRASVQGPVLSLALDEKDSQDTGLMNTLPGVAGAFASYSPKLQPVVPAVQGHSRAARVPLDSTQLPPQSPSTPSDAQRAPFLSQASDAHGSVQRPASQHQVVHPSELSAHSANRMHSGNVGALEQPSSHHQQQQQPWAPFRSQPIAPESGREERRASQTSENGVGDIDAAQHQSGLEAPLGVPVARRGSAKSVQSARSAEGARAAPQDSDTKQLGLTQPQQASHPEVSGLPVAYGSHHSSCASHSHLQSYPSLNASPDQEPLVI